MKNAIFKTFVLVGAVLFASGCATGYNHSLVSSNSNIGLDLNTEPAKIEGAISNGTGGMTPTFEGGQTLPILASISSKASKTGQFFGGQSTTVVSGDAAYNMSYLYADCNKNVEPLRNMPKVKLTKKPRTVPGPGEVKPAIFSSDSMFGLKFDLARETPLGPSAVKLGFNRQETVSTPVSTHGNAGSDLVVGTPSLIASLDHAVDLELNAEIGSSAVEQPLRYHQYFAMGEAANNMSLRSDVRQDVIRRINPEMNDSFCQDDYETRTR